MSLDLSRLDLSRNVPFQLFTVLISIFLIIDISLVYLRKILDRVFRFMNSENIFRKSLLVCLICSIPKAFLIFFNLQYGIEDNGAFTNGIGIFNITLGLPLLILKSPSACFISHSSFLKDLFFLELAFLNHFFDISQTNIQFPIFVPVFGLGVFFIFMFYTFKLPGSLNIEILTESSSYLNSGLISKPFKSIFKFIYDLLILDLERLQKTTNTLNVKLFFSPIVNVLILLTFNRLWYNGKMAIISLLSALLLGIVLIKASKTSGLSILVYFYGIVASLFHIYLFYPSYLTIIRWLSINYNLNINFLRAAILPGLISIMELSILIHYSSIGKSTLAICSLIYSTILNMLLIKSIVKIIEKQTESKYINNQANLNYFCYVFGMIASMVILFNYVVRNHRISRDLAYILIFSYCLFNLASIVEFRTYITQEV